MKLEALELWEEQELFHENDQDELGYIGAFRVRFTEDGLLSYNSNITVDENLQNECCSLIDFLKTEQGCFLLKSKSAMEACCADRFRCHIPYTFNRECLGFRVVTEEYIMYIACTPWNEKNQAVIYIYRRLPLMTALANRLGLPESCYGVLSYSGERIRIRFGMADVECFPQFGNNAVDNSAFADAENEKRKVSRGQRRAMECGVMYGWHHPLADPAGYDEDGNYIGIEDKKTGKKR